ncbi:MULTISPECIES: DUF5132 domain-containing protein [unclassified Streptomyces]|uniref:DUF5132 domain-containing protein n=1 Tax=unclassified Streptomyces TaxID=2593676 RepID=UPI002DD84748|nr:MULTISPECIES: DUF5132 domain-containing protein [unclassified Streptomyces]WSA90372.1 DUF5132 domain-containing protein [Streptomyces sp. NBC_01795]WSB74598.1 DUF5132 domain-containing protein [Streptomyces sp. NBC_01775]WSS17016.1 DUF5132 domain-containing protein [Streptomyces sp. NBC_01186]WSS45760.1 DUF5132 domain-containing protein [Streptomyces sp. NBC_01187]
MPVFPAYMAGIFTAVLAKKLGKPAVRGLVKTSLKLAADTRRAAHELNDELRDITAEAGAEVFLEDIAEPEPGKKTVPKSRAAASSEAR